MLSLLIIIYQLLKCGDDGRTIGIVVPEKDGSKITFGTGRYGWQVVFFKEMVAETTEPVIKFSLSSQFPRVGIVADV
jgi:hypothetical protein